MKNENTPPLYPPNAYPEEQTNHENNSSNTNLFSGILSSLGGENSSPLLSLLLGMKSGGAGNLASLLSKNNNNPLFDALSSFSQTGDSKKESSHSLKNVPEDERL